MKEKVLMITIIVLAMCLVFQVLAFATTANSGKWWCRYCKEWMLEQLANHQNCTACCVQNGGGPCIEWYTNSNSCTITYRCYGAISVELGPFTYWAPCGSILQR